MRARNGYENGFLITMITLLFNLPAFAATPNMEMAMVQYRLKLAGDDPGPIDGLYGRKTVATVQRFRQQKKLRADNHIYWYHVLLELTKGQLHKCRKPLDGIVNKIRRAAQPKE